MRSSTATSAACATRSARGTGCGSFSMRKLVREATFGLTEIESEDIWRCTTCGKCPQVCPRGVKQIESGVALRRIATEYDVFPHVGAADPRGGGQPARRGQSVRRGAGQARRSGPRAWPSSPSPRGWSSCISPAATCPTTRARRRSPRATVEILNKAGRGVRHPGRRGKLLRREHPQDRRRGAVQDTWRGRTSRPWSITA